MIVVVFTGSAVAGALFYRSEGLTLLTAFFAGFAMFAFAGIIETYTSFLRLEESQLSFRETFRSTVIAKSDIEKVTWEAGCGSSVLLTNGQWVRLPDLGQNSQGVTNSVRAWLEAS